MFNSPRPSYRHRYLNNTHGHTHQMYTLKIEEVYVLNRSVARFFGRA